MDEFWYKNAIIYSLDVESFMDADGDGVGDFEGLRQRLDYIAGLGVNCIWLLPCYPTPNRDDGYDVSDYYGIDPRLGTLGDFVEFMRAARDRGLHVVLDLVANHTSDQHPWFQAARCDPHSRYRDYYIWERNPPENERRGGAVFPGEQSGNWAYDAQAGAYYWHWFYEHQPDLNTGNPAVCEEIRKIMGFWLELGVSGFRVDAAPFLVKRKGIEGSYPQDPHVFLKEMRELLSSRRGDAVFLAEADVESEELPIFYGEGDRMHLAFNFLLNNNYFLALARQSAEPLARCLEQLPDTPELFQWANFVRNHDELNIERLAVEEREEVFRTFAPDPEMRIYGRGIRRRLPPMLDGDPRRLELAYSLLFSLPGTPILRYGEEIGMGDDLGLAGRMSVRTPMQWSAAPNGGFSQAPPEELERPVISGGKFGYEKVNVDAQRSDPDSLLNVVSRLIRTRRECPELGWGAPRVLETGQASVFALRYEWKGGVVVAVHNLSAKPRTITLELEPADAEQAVVLLGSGEPEPLSATGGRIELDGYGYRWLRVRSR